MQVNGEAVSVEALHGHRILLDCRSLGSGGTGRATELLLRGLRDIEPPGHWTLWGPNSVREYAWAGAVHRRNRHPLPSMKAQRAFLEVPPHDIALYMHQTRPLRPGPAVGFIHDTIPLRYGDTPTSRQLKRLFFWMVARLTTHILTVSQFSRRSLEQDIGVPAAKITVVHYPVDHLLVERVTALRERQPQRETVLYVGRYAPHKNVKRLIVAFARTGFAKGGGELLLVGGSASEVTEMRQFAAAQKVKNVRVEGTTPQARLEELYATCRLLVMPSLEEGFGLPAWEAMTCKLPVAISDGGSLRELAFDGIVSFPSTSTSAMASAIDTALQRQCLPSPLIGPTITEFSKQILFTLGQYVP